MVTKVQDSKTEHLLYGKENPNDWCKDGTSSLLKMLFEIVSVA